MKQLREWRRNRVVRLLATLTLSWAFVGPSAAGSADLLDRFFPPPGVATPAPDLSLPSIPPMEVEAATVEKHNEGVELNNRGVDALNSGNLGEAIRFFSKAAECDPREVGFTNNLLLALKRDGSRNDEALKVGLRLMALKPDLYQAPYVIGIITLDKLKRPAEALPFLEKARRLKPDDPMLAVTLAQAYDKAGYPDQAMALLREKAHQVQNDPYPMYHYGNKLLERRDYPAAIRAFQSALPWDQEGYVLDALIRARYYAGQLDGLLDQCRNALQRFPQMLNRESIERIAFSLTTQNYRLVETIQVQIGNPRAVSKLDFLVRPPANIPGYQNCRLEKAECFGGKNIPLTLSQPDGDGRIRISGPREPFESNLTLRMIYQIQRVPWLGAAGRFFASAEPDLEFLKGDEAFSLDHPQLARLEERIRREGQNFLLTAFQKVGKGLVYRENFEDHPVSWAFDNPDGCDCTEFARLLAALCLKRGLPARVVMGFLVKQEFIGKETNIGHAWCEVFFKGKGWIPVDPTLGNTLHWAYFGNLLSDQILFDAFEPGRKMRVSVDFLSTSSEVQVKITSSFLLTLVGR